MAVCLRLLVLCVISCCLKGKVHYYLNPLYPDFKWTETDSSCNVHYNRHSASIHSLRQNKEAYHQCLLASKYYINVPNCWIGLYIDSTQSYKWTDDTQYDLNPSVSRKLWCPGYPNIDPNITDEISAVYIDSNLSCWCNTYDLDTQMQLICGPPMFMDLLSWINIFYLPLGLFAIMLAYNMYICMELKNNLLTNDNWVIKPSLSVKCTSISLTILNSISCISYMTSLIIQIIGYQQTNIVPPVDLSDKEFPHIYYIALCFEGIFIISWIFASLTAYIHMLSRLKNQFEPNEYMESVIPSCCGTRKWFYICMTVLIVTIIPVLAWVLIAQQAERKHAICVYVSIVVLINVILLFMYLRGLHNYAHQHYFRDDIHKKNLNLNSILMDDKTDELMLEATRHTVVFGIAMIYNILLLFVVIILLLFVRTDDGRIVGIVAAIVITVRELLILQSIYLSFKFSHRTYEKCCCVCDTWMKNRCYGITENRHKKYLIAYHAQILTEKNQFE